MRLSKPVWLFRSQRSGVTLQVRRGFIRKVYGILMCQLILTGALIAVFTFSEPVRLWSRQSPWLYIVALVTVVVSVRRLLDSTGPSNLIKGGASG